MGQENNHPSKRSRLFAVPAVPVFLTRIIIMSISPSAAPPITLAQNDAAPPSFPLGTLKLWLRATGRGSDYYGPCEYCRQHVSETFVLMSAYENKGKLLSPNPNAYGHQTCIEGRIALANMQTADADRAPVADSRSSVACDA